jgi:predicted  nucleic acid-binding Zn-ribbon protein
MDGDVEIAKALNGKISQLKGLYEKEKENTSNLIETITGLNERIESLEAEIDTLKEANRRLKLATAFQSASDASGAKKIIDELVREIDRCVSLLNR